MKVNGIEIKVCGQYFLPLDGGDLPSVITLHNKGLRAPMIHQHLYAGRKRLLQVTPQTMEQLVEYSAARGRFMMAELYLGQRYSMSGRPEILPLKARKEGAREAMDRAASQLNIEFAGEGAGEYVLQQPCSWNAYLGGGAEYTDA